MSRIAGTKNVFVGRTWWVELECGHSVQAFSRSHQPPKKARCGSCKGGHKRVMGTGRADRRTG